MSNTTTKQIISLLQQNNFEFKHLVHKVIPKDSLGASKVRGTNIEDGAKALILKTKSNKFIQVVISANKRVSLKKLKYFLGEKNISLAAPSEVLELTGCEVGTVSPTGILWNIDVYVDESILKREKVIFSAGTKTDTIELEPHLLVKLNNATTLDISAESE